MQFNLLQCKNFILFKNSNFICFNLFMFLKCVSLYLLLIKNVLIMCVPINVILDLRKYLFETSKT